MDMKACPCSHQRVTESKRGRERGTDRDGQAGVGKDRKDTDDDKQIN